MKTQNFECRITSNLLQNYFKITKKYLKFTKKILQICLLHLGGAWGPTPGSENRPNGPCCTHHPLAKVASSSRRTGGNEWTQGTLEKQSICWENPSEFLGVPPSPRSFGFSWVLLGSFWLGFYYAYPGSSWFLPAPPGSSWVLFGFFSPSKGIGSIVCKFTKSKHVFLNSYMFFNC